MTDKLNFGDIVTIDDYPMQYFRINGFQTNTLETENEPTITEKWLDLSCAHTGGYTMAFAEEATLVASKEDADAFLADKPAPIIEDFGGLALMSIFDFERETPIGPPLTSKSKATQMDELLDELDAVIQTRELMREINHADVAEYERRADEIKAKLAEISGGD